MQLGGHSNFNQVTSRYYVPNTISYCKKHSGLALWTGFGHSTAKRLLQNGIADDQVNQIGKWRWWYEAYPAKPVYVSGAVASGETMTFTTKYGRTSPGEVMFFWYNNSTGKYNSFFATSLSGHSAGYYRDGNSALIIAERPLYNGTPLQLRRWSSGDVLVTRAQAGYGSSAWMDLFSFSTRDHVRMYNSSTSHTLANTLPNGSGTSSYYLRHYNCV